MNVPCLEGGAVGGGVKGEVIWTLTQSYMHMHSLSLNLTFQFYILGPYAGSAPAGETGEASTVVSS